MKLSVGIGLTDKCQLNCKFCYSKPHDGRFLQKEKVFELLDKFPVGSVNFGTGESIFHPDFVEIVEHCQNNRKLSLTSNGLSVSELSDYHLQMFNDIDFSLDFPDEHTQNQWRGGDCFKMVLDGLEKCKRLNIKASVVSIVMKHNIHKLPEILGLARSYNASLRLNLYKNSNSIDLAPTCDDFWSGMQKLFDVGVVQSCSEPILAVHPSIKAQQQPLRAHCGVTSMRIKPDGRISACPYDRQGTLHINEVVAEQEQLFNWFNTNSKKEMPVPEKCVGCSDWQACQGGCRARRELENIMTEPDPYCFKFLADIPDLNVNANFSNDHVHSQYLCTAIFS